MVAISMRWRICDMVRGFLTLLTRSLVICSPCSSEKVKFLVEPVRIPKKPFDFAIITQRYVGAYVCRVLPGGTRTQVGGFQRRQRYEIVLITR